MKHCSVSIPLSPDHRLGKCGEPAVWAFHYHYLNDGKWSDREHSGVTYMCQEHRDLNGTDDRSAVGNVHPQPFVKL